MRIKTLKYWSDERRSMRCCVVYFIRASNGRIKIGVTDDLKARFSALRSSSPCELEILVSVEGDELTEREMHERFKASRSHGEWFDPSPDLIAYIDTVRSRP